MVGLRLWLARVLIGSLAVWGLINVSRDARWNRWSCDQPEPIEAPTYRVGTPTWNRLADFTAWIETTVPAGEVLAFRAASNKIAIARYASYLLPRHHVIAVRSQKVPRGAEYMASFGGPWRADEAITLLAQHPEGWIYQRP